MRLLVLAVGRVRGPHGALCEDYLKRFTVWPCEVREVEVRGGGSAPSSKDKEGSLLLAGIPKGARIVVCDERGQNMPSLPLSQRLAAWQDGGARDVAFLLGGADGHTEAVRQRADLLLSFGALTWPHALARVMLLEQLYRAQQIHKGHPYHRE